jgi:DNA polymerase
MPQQLGLFNQTVPQPVSQPEPKRVAETGAPAQPAHASLDELITEMVGMTHDPLANAGTNVVICRGNPQARLMIVGEAPGPQENIQGKPFVGKAGQMLDKVLEAANFNPESDVFITNSVFRMPPGEAGETFRKPTSLEIDFYRPYVQEIIRLVNPRILLLTGNVACESLLRQTGITKLRGQWVQQGERWLMPIFHPSYLLRNPVRAPGSPKALMWEDIQEVRRKYDELAA